MSPCRFVHHCEVLVLRREVPSATTRAMLSPRSISTLAANRMQSPRSTDRRSLAMDLGVWSRSWEAVSLGISPPASCNDVVLHVSATILFCLEVLRRAPQVLCNPLR